MNTNIPNIPNYSITQHQPVLEHNTNTNIPNYSVTQHQLVPNYSVTQHQPVPEHNTNKNTVYFPDNIDNLFEQYIPEYTLPYRELPLGDYKIVSEREFKTKDNRKCMVLTLQSKNQTMITVYVPERLQIQISMKPNTYKYLRNLGLKTSETTGNQYFNFQLA